MTEHDMESLLRITLCHTALTHQMNGKMPGNVKSCTHIEHWKQGEDIHCNVFLNMHIDEDG